MAKQKCGLRPLSDKVVVLPDEPQKVTKGGIHLPDQAQKADARGTVVAVGPGRLNDDGTHSEMEVKAGDRVVFSKYAGTLAPCGGVDYSVMRESDVVAVVEGE